MGRPKRMKIQAEPGLTREQRHQHDHANPDMAKGLHEIARSGKAGGHADRRFKRNRDRLSQRRNAISEQREY